MIVMEAKTSYFIIKSTSIW